jgi:oligogalacturonide transport system substrate-binding protein
MNQTTANAAALALVGALALQLAACGTAQQSAPGQASTQPEPVTLTMSWWGDDARTETYQQAIQAFEAKLQYITVETIYGTTADEDQTADVMQVDWTWPGQNADQFVDLNEYSDVIDLEQFSQSALDACTVDGALLAVPMSVTGRIFYWNTCTFEQAGIDAPKTYEELLTAGNTFREVLGEEYYPLAMDAAARMNLMVSYLESTTGKAWVVDRQLQYSADEIKTGLEAMQNKLDLATDLASASREISGEYPAWSYNADSVIRPVRRYLCLGCRRRNLPQCVKKCQRIFGRG